MNERASAKDRMMERLRLIVAALALAAARGEAARVEFEAETYADCNVARNLAPGPTRPTLSGGAELRLESPGAIRVRYEFAIATDGAYALWAREYYRNGQSALRWRVDAGPWTEVKQDWGLTMSEMIDSHTYNDWGRVALTPGGHTLEIETTRPRYVRPPRRPEHKDVGPMIATEAMMPGNDHRFWVDAFILTTEPLVGLREHAKLFEANGLLKDVPPRDAADWFALPWTTDDFAPSILDAIHPTPKPIGNGPESRLRRNGDRFEYADGRRFAAWGQSAPTAPPKSEAEYYAKRARRLGLTAIRLHSLDGGLCDIHAGRNYVLDEQRLDRMEYFIHCLKHEGIYVMIDPLYNWQTPMVGATDGLPDGVVIKSRVRQPFYFDPYLQKLNREFIRRILTHRNPYTGLRNGEDPAVAFFQIVNENSLFAWGLDQQHEHFQKMLDRRFNEWLVERYGDRAKLAVAWGGALGAGEDPAAGTVQRDRLAAVGKGDARDADRRKRLNDGARFLYDVQTGFYQSVRRYVESELGFKGMLYCGSGWFGFDWLDTLDIASNLPEMDFFDQHGYGTLRRGALRPKNDTTPEKAWPWFSNIEKFASKAPAGVPWTASEWNDGYAVDGPLTIACYGALQGWDGLFQYRLDGFDGVRTGGGLVGHSGRKAQAYLQYPLACLAFVRGAVREGGLVERRVILPGRLFDCTRRGDDFRQRPWAGTRALIGKCELAFTDIEPRQADTAAFVRGDGDSVDSNTGELTWSARLGTLHIKAPALQGLVGQADGEPVTLGAVTIKIEPAFASVAVGAVDDRPLATSRRMFLCAVGETRGAGTPEDPEERKKGKFIGLPLLMKPVVGDVTFAAPVKAVYALDIAGQRKAEVELADDGRTFRLDNTHRTPWFEVIR